MTTQFKKAPETNGKTNRIGLLLGDYKGHASTLCAGCGHDAITSSIIKACFELGIEPRNVAKLSGIGCSSKTSNYFLDQSHGFNAVHGRMASIATGAHLANRELINLGVSGDGDTASIGLGTFLHMVRRNVPMVYIVENNGCYGLTKGQFSATADVGSVKKGGKDVNDLAPVDICALAIQMGCHFVARSFSGDTQQVRTLLKAAMAHSGTAVLDIISPCVTFNNHDASTKSYTHHKKHEFHLQDPSFVPHFEHIDIDYEAGTTQEVKMHDGSTLFLKKLVEDYDPTDKHQAERLITDTHTRSQVLTGLIYLDSDRPTLADTLNLVDRPLAALDESDLRPSREALEQFNARLRL